MNKVSNWEQFSKIDTSNPFYFFKNSTTCPISQAALEEVQNFSQDHNTLPFYYLNVQESQDLSNRIAENWEVKHESPQLLIFADGKVQFHDSHWNITYSVLEEKSKKFI